MNSRKTKNISIGYLVALLSLCFLGTFYACESDAKEANEQSKYALVIGNGEYKVGPLKNAPNDAILMGETLKSLGFKLVKDKVHLNVTKEELSLLILDLGDILKTKKSVGLFYFSGHGIQFEGNNYLIPIGAKLEREEYVKIYGISLNEVSRKFENAQTDVNLMILDACRNNPFASKYRSATRGFKMQQAPNSTLIFYATRPGEVSLDGDGNHSPFTTSLTKNMQVPGVKIEEVFKTTIREVKDRTYGKQIPWQEGFILSDFYFVQPNPTKLKPTKLCPKGSRLIGQTCVANQSSTIAHNEHVVSQTHYSSSKSFWSSVPSFTYYSLGLALVAHSLNLTLNNQSIVNPAFYLTYTGYGLTTLGLGWGSINYLTAPSSSQIRQDQRAFAQQIAPSLIFPLALGTF